MINEVIKRPNVLTDINTKNDIVDRLSKEETNSSIARSYNVTQGRISQIKSENQAVIDKKKQELILQLPNIVESVRTDIETNNRLSRHISLDFTNINSDLISLKNTLDKTSLNVLKIASIFPTNALLNFNQYNQDNRQINIEPSIMGLFGGGFSDSMQVIDMKEDSNSDAS